MTAEEARALLRRLVNDVAPEIDFQKVDMTGPIQDELSLDSMDFLNLIVAVHETTGLEIPESDYPSLATVDGFVAYLVETRR